MFVIGENVASGFVLASARGSRSFLSIRAANLSRYSREKFVSASRRNQHASRGRSPDPCAKNSLRPRIFPLYSRPPHQMC